MFQKLRNQITHLAHNFAFEDACTRLQTLIFAYSKQQLKSIITPIGIIPEDIPHDSTEEKIYAKAADIVLAKCFQELGLSSIVVKQRSGCADVVAKSIFHNYSLVADAKAFRLSRTAKNQKDFKVQSMAHWRGDNDFSILTCPYFQYPLTHSQIYTQALEGNVLLFSWEHFSYMLEKGIKENEHFSLAPLWNASAEIAKQFSIADKEIFFWDKQDLLMCNFLNCTIKDFKDNFESIRKKMIRRGENEILYYKEQLKEINAFSREQAIKELIKHRKIHEKVATIQKFIQLMETSSRN